MAAPVTVVWFQRDLRLADHPALALAAMRGPVVGVYVHDAEGQGPWAPGGAARWWLHHSLEVLRTGLEANGSALLLRRGPVAEALLDVAKAVKASAVFWNRRVDAPPTHREEALRPVLEGAGLAVRVMVGDELAPPGTVLTGQGTPYQVFTPFYNALLTTPVSKPLPPVKRLWMPPKLPPMGKLADLDLLPAWPHAFGKAWVPGEVTALMRAEHFLKTRAAHYGERRDLLGENATARLSPHLAFGEISPRVLWHHAHAEVHAPWLRQLAWREFARHLFHHFPHTATQPLDPKFARFPWRDDGAALKRWQRGQTGYPLVDAGMRQLWRTGWMHNRARMVCASFLVKHLLVPWQQGAQWFWDTLLDADLPNNTLGWQWTAGCGADAAPYFRVFNPARQQEKFDADGEYVRRWLPKLGTEDDPPPMVEHAAARERALAAYGEMKKEIE